MARRPKRPDKRAPEVAPPRGLRATRFAVAGREVVVMSYPTGASALPDTLSAAEQEVARALLRGATNAEIAEARGVSARTVANQIASIFKKLGVSSRAELASKLRK